MFKTLQIGQSVKNTGIDIGMIGSQGQIIITRQKLT